MVFIGYVHVSLPYFLSSSPFLLFSLSYYLAPLTSFSKFFSCSSSLSSPRFCITCCLSLSPSSSETLLHYIGVIVAVWCCCCLCCDIVIVAVVGVVIFYFFYNFSVVFIACSSACLYYCCYMLLLVAVVVDLCSCIWLFLMLLL